MLRRTCKLIRPCHQYVCAAWPSEQKRYEHMLRRMHPPELGVEGEQRLIEPEAAPKQTHADISWVHVWNNDLKHYKTTGDEFVFIHQKDTSKDPQGNMDVILCWPIQGLGLPGDVVSVDREFARHKLIPLGAALYNIPEHHAQMEQLKKDSESRRLEEGDRTVPEEHEHVVQLLRAIQLPVPMNLQRESEWALNASHLRVALRLQGVMLPEKCIALPNHAITSQEPFTFTVTLWNNAGQVHTQIPVSAKIVDHLSPEARSPPAAVGFQFTKRTLTDSLLDALYARDPAAKPEEEVDERRIRASVPEPEKPGWQPIWEPGYKKKKVKTKWIKRKG